MVNVVRDKIFNYRKENKGDIFPNARKIILVHDCAQMVPLEKKNFGNIVSLLTMVDSRIIFYFLSCSSFRSGI